MTAPDQLLLPLLPARTARGRDDFFVSPSNAMAVAMIDNWRTWPGGKCLLTGPQGSGKTHLAHVWATASGARIIPALELAQADIPDLAQQPVCVEDVHVIAGNRPAEEALFHLHNLALAQGQPLLITGIGAPQGWPLTLPDLQSRLLSTQILRLEDPDDALLGALLAKLFADRQIVPAPDVLPYLLKCMPRSHDSAARIVAALDAAALGSKGGVTRPLAVRVMAQLAQSDA
jgi:chromosomal replication initiation ATPase DnaA